MSLLGGGEEEDDKRWRVQVQCPAGCSCRVSPLSTVHRSYSTRHPTPAQPCPLINPQGGPSVIGPISTSFPFQLDIKTRQFQPANHFHSLPLPMCRYGIFIYTIPHRTMLALHCTVGCCCRMSGFRHFVLCQQCYIHIASLQGRPHRWGPFLM